MSKQIPKGGLAFENSWTVPTMKTKQNKKPGLETFQTATML